MLKRILIAVLLWPLVALAQSYPSPTFNNLTVQGTFTLSGGLPPASLAAQAANTVLANVTASSASPTAVALPSCSTSSSALNYTSASGFSCNTAINASSLGGNAANTYAPLASPTLTGTPTAPTAALATNTTQIATTAFVIANSVTSSSPTITTPNIVGVTNGSNAAAGSVGEVIQSNVTTATSISNATSTNLTSITLTAGDWEVYGSVCFVGTATLSATAAGFNTTSATFPANGLFWWLNGTGLGSSLTSPVPTQRFNVTGSTVIYLVGSANFSSGTATYTAYVHARRIR